MSKLKVTIEHEGNVNVIETDYLMMMHGEKKEDGTLKSIPLIHNLTYPEATRTIALFGWVVIEEFNKIRNKEVLDK